MGEEVLPEDVVRVRGGQLRHEFMVLGGRSRSQSSRLLDCESAHAECMRGRCGERAPKSRIGGNSREGSWHVGPAGAGEWNSEQGAATPQEVQRG